MMAGVNNAVNYYDTTMKLGYEDSSTGSPVITNSLLQGGIVRSLFLYLSSLPSYSERCDYILTSFHINRSQSTTSVLSSVV